MIMIKKQRKIICECCCHQEWHACICKIITCKHCKRKGKEDILVINGGYFCKKHITKNCIECFEQT